MQNACDISLREHATQQIAKVWSARAVPCKICGEEAVLFDWVDFNKACDARLYPLGLMGVPVAYRKCRSCGFLFSDFFDDFSPAQWRTHIYNDQYVVVDPDYIAIRPLDNAREVFAFFGGQRRDVTGLDFGGGSGLMAKLLRREGWTYDCYDPFGHTDMAPDRMGRYNFCSAFEVFEHTVNPVESLAAILEKMVADCFYICIGTGVHDGLVTEESRLRWWYVGPRNGHVSIFSRAAMAFLAQRFGLQYHAVSYLRGTHLLTRGISPRAAYSMLLRGKVTKRLRRSLNLWPGVLKAGMEA